MSYVIKVLMELISDPAVKARLFPAIKDPKSNKIYVARSRTEDHEDILARHPSINVMDKSFDYGIHRGFYDHSTKKYHTHDDAGLETPDLMNQFQRVKKYGTDKVY